MDEIGAETPSADGQNKPNEVQSMDQRRLQMLSAAFKGNIGPQVNKNYARKPSVLTLTKRVGDTNSNLTEQQLHQVKFLLGRDVDLGGTNRTNSDIGDRRSIMKGRIQQSEENQVRNEQPFQHILRDTQDKEVDEGPLNQEEVKRTELLSTIQFHKQTDQSISRIDLQVNAERKWLKEFPQSATWDALQNRVLQYQSPQGVQALRAQNEMADRFLDTALLLGATHVNNLLNGADNEKERLVVRLTFALLEDAVDEAIAEVGAETLKRSAQGWGLLNKSLAKALASVSLGMEGSSSRYCVYVMPAVFSDC